MRAAHRAMLLAAAVGAELRNHGCPNLRFLNHTGRSLACVRLHSTQQRLGRAKRCLLDGVAALARSRRRSSMLQVGAHLAFGNANDPFKRLALDVINHTVLVEPQPGVYRDLAALVAAHADPAHRVAVVNRAVSDRDGVVTFHTINDTVIDPATGCYRRGFEPPGDEACPAWFTSQIASLSLKNILKHKRWIPNLEALVVDVEVRASTVRTLLDEHDLRDDLVVLSVDAEGHDEIIVRSVDLSKITPYFIVFEHMHIMYSAAGALGHVLESGYDCLMVPENYFCVRDRALFAACCPARWHRIKKANT
jgi:FkbM family methyltransferase